MDIASVLAVMDATIADRFREAIALGKWPNGVALTDSQREVCMQALIMWESQNRPEEERVGYIDRGSKKQGEQCADDAPAEQPLVIKPLLS